MHLLCCVILFDVIPWTLSVTRRAGERKRENAEGATSRKKRLSKRILASSFAQEWNVSPFHAFTRIRVSILRILRYAKQFSTSEVVCKVLNQFLRLFLLTSFEVSRANKTFIHESFYNNIDIFVIWTKVFIVTVSHFYWRANIRFLQRLKQSISDKRNNLIKGLFKKNEILIITFYFH